VLLCVRILASTHSRQGSHVQITARSDRDLTPESIIRKVADASGANYSGASVPSASSSGPPPPVASKPVFQPSQSGGGQRGFAPLASRSRPAASAADDENDGWGSNAPQVSRSQLEKVESSYKPTKVNMSELTSQKQEPSRFKAAESAPSNNDDVVRGGYQPVGKIDIAAIRRQAQGSGSTQDDRPTTVKGAYEPVGKVDIAAIRARAAPSSPDPVSATRTGGSAISANKTGGSAQDTPNSPSSLADRSAAFTSSERMTSMPKPKVANKFGSSSSSFAGTRAPSYGAPITSAGLSAPGRSMSSAAGKTPAQIWAEKKAAQGGASAPAAPSASAASPVAAQKSGGFESGYAGKKWGAVQIPKPGQSMPDEADEPAAAEEEEAEAPRPPPMDMSSKPNASGRGVPMPGMPRPVPTPQEDDEEEESAQEPAGLPVPPPPQPPRSPEPEEDENADEYARPSSPIRVAMPIGRAAAPMRAPSERFEPQPLPTRSLAQVVPHEDELEEEPQEEEQDTARHAAQAAAASTFGESAVQHPNIGGDVGGKRAIAQFDYEKAEENELELHEGEEVTNIEMVDEDWWMGENTRGEKGLFPSNYVELVEGGESAGAAAAALPPAPAAREEPAAHTAASHAPPAPAPAASGVGATATAQFDYEAVEDNELSFPDGATIENVVCPPTSLQYVIETSANQRLQEFPDEDWWMGEYEGNKGLFPANYVQLNE